MYNTELQNISTINYKSAPALSITDIHWHNAGTGSSSWVCSLAAHLNDLSSLKGQLLRGVWVGRHQRRVVGKQGHKKAHVWVVQLLLLLPAQDILRLSHPDAIWVEIHIQSDHAPVVVPARYCTPLCV